MGSLDRLLYVDDSGSERFGWIVYGWVECSPRGWRRGLRSWLELHKELWRDHQIPPATELHATHYSNGRGRVSTNPQITLWKDLGREVAQNGLALLADCEDLKVGATYRKTSASGTDYYRQKADLYRQLVEHWDQEHAAEDSFVLVSMDGEGTDPIYFNAHRSLPLDTRHVIEDPLFHDSKRSQWMQMADLVAYTVYQHLDRHQHNEFAQHWYAEYLQGSDVNGVPLAL